MLRNVCWVVFILALTFTALQCGSTKEAPTIPPSPDNLKRATIPEDAGQSYLWGEWQISVEKATGEVRITQLRQSDLALNVTGFLEGVPLTNLSVDFNTLVIDAANNYIYADVILTHPFVTPDGIFDGFDVRGVVFGPEVRNADGWTAAMNPIDFSGEVFGYIDGVLGAPNGFAQYSGEWFGYKYFCDGLGLNEDVVTHFSDEINLANRGVFEEGSTNARPYELYFGDTYTDFLVFNYAVVASYDWPIGDPPFQLDDFDITTCNMAESFCGDVTITNNTLGMDGQGNVVGELSFDIEVWDWQGLGTTAVQAVSGILAPGVPVVVYDPGTTSKSGIFHVNGLSGGGSGQPGLNYVWVVVTDTSQTFGSSWFMDLLSPGNPRYNDPVFTIYPILIDIPDNTPPVAGAEVDNPAPALNTDVTFDGTSTFDAQSNDAELTFEWDLDGDGQYDDGNTMIVITQYSTESTYTVDLRVTDPGGLQDTLDTPLQIEVSYCGGSDAHIESTGDITISNFSVLPNNIKRYGLSFMTTGPYSGQAVMQSGPYSLGTFDADGDGTVNGSILCKLTPYYYYNSGTDYQPNIPFIIDVCPQGGYVLVVTDTRLRIPGYRTVHTDMLEAYAPDGSGVVYRIRDDVDKVLHAVCAIDCDDNGDIWMVGWNAGLSTPFYFLIRIPYTGGSPPWETDPANFDSYDVSSYFNDDTNDVIDMVIDYQDNYIYILSTDDGNGKLSCFDFTSGVPVYNTALSVVDVFSADLIVGSDTINGFWNETKIAFGGVEIDHIDSTREKCRIVCYGRIDDGSSGDMPEVVRINHLGEILDSTTGTLSLRNFGLNNNAGASDRHVTFPGPNNKAKRWTAAGNW